MSVVAFDTLEYFNSLTAVGFSKEQAEIQAKAIAQLVEKKLATKHDMKNLEQDIKILEERLTYKLTVRFGSISAASVTLLAVLIKIL